MAWLLRFLLGLCLGFGLLALGWRLDHGSRRVAADFVREFESASIRRPSPEVFAVHEVAIAGTSKPSITVEQPSRLAWDVTVPNNAWLEAGLALREEAWAQPGDGVLFRIGISFSGRYDELLTQIVNPFARAEDRRWVPVEIDLSAYEGRQVSITFNTGSGLDGDNRENDLAVWGAPRLMAR